MRQMPEKVLRREFVTPLLDFRDRSKDTSQAFGIWPRSTKRLSFWPVVLEHSHQLIPITAN